MNDPIDHPDLNKLRLMLDELDGQLVDILADRARIVHQVIEVKRSNAMDAVDIGREQEMLSRIETISVAKGLDPRIARLVLRSIIDSFVLIEMEELS
jgi:chorismate mutase